MSAQGEPEKGFGSRSIQALALAATFGVLFAATRLAPEFEGHLRTVSAVGFLLLAGTLLSELLEIIGLPHLSGYLLAGVLGGPHVLHLVDHHTVEGLSRVNALALALIALAGGAELRIDTLRGLSKSLGVAMLVQSVFVLAASAGAFVALAPSIPFVQGFSFWPVLGVALLWGVLSVSRSPAACLAILSQTRARGPVSTFSLAFVMASDVVVVVLLAIATMIARLLLGSAEGFSLHSFEALGHELLGSVAVGTTLGLVLAAYLRLVGGQFLLVLLGVGFVLTDFLRYVHFDPLLAFLTAGFVVQNMTGQGARLLHEVEKMASVVFVIFFATAGAHLDLPLLARLWPVALVLAGSRAAATFVAARLSSRLAGDVPTVRAWGWSSLISQAGLTLGLAVVVGRAFPTFAEGFRSLAIAVVALNEVIGPILFKLALERAGETHREDLAVRTSLAPKPRATSGPA
ncbi:MAG TPA: sodium:proton exchanger [Polyangiaceae bacterium]|jgi:Kef-type K+ transport system membrane component KefB